MSNNEKGTNYLYLLKKDDREKNVKTQKDTTDAQNIEMEAGEREKVKECIKLWGALRDLCERNYEILKSEHENFSARFNSGEIIESDELEKYFSNLEPFYDFMKKADLLKQDEKVRAFFEHDLGTVSTVILGNLQRIKELKSKCENGKGQEMGELLEDSAVILENWPTYSYVIEDILMRRIHQDPKEFNPDLARPMNFTHLSAVLKPLSDNVENKLKKMDPEIWLQRKKVYDLLDELEKEGERGIKVADTDPRLQKKTVLDHELKAMQGRLEKRKKIEQLFFADANELNGLLEENEEIRVNPGEVVNALLNVICNACTAHVDATKVELKFFRQGDHMVIEVVDNGIGMKQETYLERGHDNDIFKKGRSHRKSSGIGLTFMPERMKAMGCILTVASAPKEEIAGQTGDYPFFYTNSPEEINKNDFAARLKRDQSGHRELSTIFQFKIPIKKK